MKLWLISQTKNDDYDTFDSAIVAAETEQRAKEVFPNNVGDVGFFWAPGSGNPWNSRYSSWAPSPEYVVAVCIGEALEGTIEGHIFCSSFNAG